MRISDCVSYVCSSDLGELRVHVAAGTVADGHVHPDVLEEPREIGPWRACARADSDALAVEILEGFDAALRQRDPVERRVVHGEDGADVVELLALRPVALAGPAFEIGRAHV